MGRRFGRWRDNALNNDFLLNIQSVYPSLTKAEKKVADYTLQNSKAVRFLSITDLAEACHVSLTSVFRFCKVLKLQGYQEFKVQLALSIQEEGQGEEIELLPAAVTKADSVPTAAKKLLQSHINALSETHALVDEAALSRAAHYINHSDQVRFFGVGGSMLTAMEGMYKFLHIMPNVYCLSDIHMQTMGASTLNQHDTAVFISHSGASKEIVQMAQKGRRRRGRKQLPLPNTQNPLSPNIWMWICCAAVTSRPCRRARFPLKRRRCLCWICFLPRCTARSLITPRKLTSGLRLPFWTKITKSLL